MKMTYTTPAMEVFKSETRQMLATSTIGIDSSQYIDDPGDVLAPKFQGYLDDLGFDSDDLYW